MKSLGLAREGLSHVLFVDDDVKRFLLADDGFGGAFWSAGGATDAGVMNKMGHFESFFAESGLSDYRSNSKAGNEGSQLAII